MSADSPSMFLVFLSTVMLFVPAFAEPSIILISSPKVGFTGRVIVIADEVLFTIILSPEEAV